MKEEEEETGSYISAEYECNLLGREVPVNDILYVAWQAEIHTALPAHRVVKSACGITSFHSDGVDSCFSYSFDLHNLDHLLDSET